MSSELDQDHHLLRKENGFRNYFEEHALTGKIIIQHICDTRSDTIENYLLNELNNQSNIGAIFVTNSRVNIIANILKKADRKKVLVIGYDFLQENIKGLTNGDIDILICQRPTEQGYLGINALYKHLFKIGEANGNTYMPIDIITKENYRFYNV
ncbi:MAG: transcriptional regulator, LacI family [Mucilaginibacter sp.]|nr:transcriptional regulator, LacI family [Mucilaginibacter sp.]